jgi:hypothetical protein
LAWLPTRRPLPQPTTRRFEVVLAPDVLNEQPRQTNIDWLVLARTDVLAAEAKFTERGFGTCSCEAWPKCSGSVLTRPYWEVAGRELGLSRSAATCALSLAYQPIRNIAAAAAIAQPHRHASFLLVYDARNPYFGGGGRWPGWDNTLRDLTASGDVEYVSLTWQSLLALPTLDGQVRAWALEKHGLEGGS